MGKKYRTQVTMKDIALKTGYSVNTVSLTLKGAEAVTEETKAKILKAADELGYIGNSVASSMRSGYTKNIAMLVGDVANPYFAQIIKQGVSVLSKRGYNVMVYNTEERDDFERKCIRSAIRQNVDGILFCPMSRYDKNINLLLQSRVPFVVFGGLLEDKRINMVSLDDVKGGYLATKYLLEQGHRKLVFVNAPESALGSIERLEGFKQALAEYGIPYQPENVLEFRFALQENNGWEEIKYALSQRLEYTGVVAFSDMIAMRLIQLFQSESFRQKQITQADIVGFDNSLQMFPLSVNFPSVSFSELDMSVVAPQMLLDMLERDIYTPRRIVLDVKLYRH